jgi:uncharacterized phage protein (TIGR01671 family)
MKDIKFRAWDIVNKKMIYNVFEINNVGHAVEALDCDFGNGTGTFKMHLTTNTRKIPLMQYTGLKDKNGKEIYEGDIVKWGHLEGSIENPVRIAIVEFNPDIQFRRTGVKKENCFYGQNYIFNFGSFAYKNTEDCLEIIGNIHQHKHLLTEGK